MRFTTYSEIHLVAKKDTSTFTADQLANQLQVATSTIHRWARLGQIPAPLRINGRPRWRLVDIASWQEEQTNGQGEEAVEDE